MDRSYLAGTAYRQARYWLILVLIGRSSGVYALARGWRMPAVLFGILAIGSAVM